MKNKAAKNDCPIMDQAVDMSDVIKLIRDIQHGKLLNSHNVALRTEVILKSLIADGKWKTAQELMEMVKQAIKTIQEYLPLATAGNIMRHTLKIIREEYESVSKRKGADHSLHQLVTANRDSIFDYSEILSNLKTGLMDQLAEYKVELESSIDNIACQAPEHIHANEIILTVGRSNTVEKFLKYAARSRTFQVIVVESFQVDQGHLMAANLAKSNIHTTVIPDSAVFAIMSRVNKVIIGTHTVLANGGLRALSGVHAVALAARHYSVAVVVLAHMYKLTPVHVGYYEQAEFNVCASPANTIPYSTGSVLNEVELSSPMFDYVPPELVTLFISNQGGNAPSYVYRMLSELYHPEDYEI